jgi:molybdopterin molybdotransferase
VRAGVSYRKKPGRREYLRASLKGDRDSLVAIKYPYDGSAILSSIVRSEGLALDENAGDLAAGSMVDFRPFTEALA